MEDEIGGFFGFLFTCAEIVLLGWLTTWISGESGCGVGVLFLMDGRAGTGWERESRSRFCKSSWDSFILGSNPSLTSSILEFSLVKFSTIGNHELPSTGKMAERIFGLPDSNGYDGVHMRGPDGVRALTDSIINNIKNQNQARRKMKTISSLQEEVHIRTSNRFDCLNK